MVLERGIILVIGSLARHLVIEGFVLRLQLAQLGSAVHAWCWTSPSQYAEPRLNAAGCAQT